MPTKINGAITDVKQVELTDREKLQREMQELQGENVYLKKQLFELRKVAQSLSGPVPGGT